MQKNLSGLPVTEVLLIRLGTGKIIGAERRPRKRSQGAWTGGPGNNVQRKELQFRRLDLVQSKNIIDNSLSAFSD
jgi:hypothetical protein